MKTVVLANRPGIPPRFNDRFLAYANARGGFAVVACTPGHPQGKGGVERGIRTVRESFWTGRRFASLGDLNAQASNWLNRVHNRRTHATTGKVSALVFEHEERAKLKPVPATPFDTDDSDHEIVSSTFRVRFDRNTYSVPWHLEGQRVIVRGTDDHVRVFLGPKCVAEHPRCWDAGQDCEDPEHPLAYKACTETKRVVFAKMLNELHGAQIHGRIERVLRKYTHADLLVIDDFASLEMDGAQANLAFQVISERYDYRRSTAITTNRPFKEWPKVFPDPLNAQVIAERLSAASTSCSRTDSVSRRTADLSPALEPGEATSPGSSDARAYAARRSVPVRPPAPKWLPGAR